MTADRKKGLLSASAGSVFWGSSGIAGQFLLINEHIAPAWLTFFRLLTAGFLLLLLTHFFKGNIFALWKDQADRRSLLIFSAFGMLGTQYGYFASIQYSNAPTATILEYLMPILIIFWYCLSEKRRPRMRELFCAFFAIAGTALIATGGDFKSLAISEKALFWGLLSALACALYTVEPVRIIKKYGAPLVVGWGMFTASFFLLPVTVLTPFTGAWIRPCSLPSLMWSFSARSAPLFSTSAAWPISSPRKPALFQPSSRCPPSFSPSSSSASPSVSGSSSAWPSSSWPWQQWQENKGPSAKRLCPPSSMRFADLRGARISTGGKAQTPSGYALDSPIVPAVPVHRFPPHILTSINLYVML